MNRSFPESPRSRTRLRSASLRSWNPISPSHVSTYPGRPDRPTLVFVHGVYHGAWAFEDFQRPFNAAGHPVALVDLRGHRGEHRLTPQSDVGYADYVEDTQRALDRIPGQKVLIGHSLGGLLAISLATRSDLNANVIIAAPLPEVIRRKQWRLLLEFPFQTARYLATGDASVLYHDEQFIDRYFFSRHTPGPIKAHANARIREQHEPSRLFREIVGLQLRPTPSRLPTLIVLGAEDPTVTPSVGEALGKLTGGRVVVIPEAGHDLMLESSSSIAVDTIMRWMDQIRFSPKSTCFDR